MISFFISKRTRFFDWRYILVLHLSSWISFRWAAPIGMGNWGKLLQFMPQILLSIRSKHKKLKRIFYFPITAAYKNWIKLLLWQHHLRWVNFIGWKWKHSNAKGSRADSGETQTEREIELHQHLTHQLHIAFSGSSASQKLLAIEVQSLKSYGLRKSNVQQLGQRGSRGTTSD